MGHSKQHRSCCGNLKRDEEERKTRAGGIETVGVWRKTGPDDFAHAWAYCRLAFLIRPATRMQVRLIGAAAHAQEQDDDYETIYEKSDVWDDLMVPKRIKRIPVG